MIDLQALADGGIFLLIVFISTFLDAWLSLPLLHGINDKDKGVYYPLIFFGIINSLIGLLFYKICGLSNDVNKVPSTFKGAVVAFLYLSFINQKVLSKKSDKDGNSTEIGIVKLYSSAKLFFFNQANNTHLRHLLKEFNGKNDIRLLRKAANVRAGNDILKSLVERRKDLAWIEELERAENININKEKEYLKSFIDNGFNDQKNNNQ